MFIYCKINFLGRFCWWIVRVGNGELEWLLKISDIFYFIWCELRLNSLFEDWGIFVVVLYLNGVILLDKFFV